METNEIELEEDKWKVCPKGGEHDWQETITEYDGFITCSKCELMDLLFHRSPMFEEQMGKIPMAVDDSGEVVDAEEIEEEVWSDLHTPDSILFAFMKGFYKSRHNAEVIEIVVRYKAI